MALCLCVSLTKTPRENRIFEHPLLEVQSAFQAFWTPILKYTNIDYQCVTNLSPKSDEDRKSLPKPLRKEGMLDTFKRWGTPVFVIEAPTLQSHVGGDASRVSIVSCKVIWFCDAGRVTSYTLISWR